MRQLPGILVLVLWLLVVSRAPGESVQAIPLIPLAMGAVSAYNAFKNRGQGQQRRPSPNMAQFDARVARAGQVGQETEDEYLRRLKGFNPMQAATQAATAQYNIAMPQIQRQVANLRGSQAGSRLNTGYGMQDQDQLLTDNLNNLNQSIIARAMDAAQMERGVISEMGQYGQNNTNLWLDATYGRYQTEEDRRAQERQSRWGLAGGLFSAAAQGAGAYYGAR